MSRRSRREGRDLVRIVVPPVEAAIHPRVSTSENTGMHVVKTTRLSRAEFAIGLSSTRVEVQIGKSREIRSRELESPFAPSDTGDIGATQNLITLF